MSEHIRIRIGLEQVQAAVDTRAEITARYATYKILSTIVQTTAMVEHSDFKGAVDALYYLGGGWPSQNSKGRMEKALDNVAGMYKVLSLVSRGHLIEGHLDKLGISITLRDPIINVPLSKADIGLLNDEFDMAQFDFKPKDLAELVTLCIEEAEQLQKFICQNADMIKDVHKPAAKNALGVEDEEYDRLFFMTKFQDKPKKLVDKKNIINHSVQQFREVTKTAL